MKYKPKAKSRGSLLQIINQQHVMAKEKFFRNSAMHNQGRSAQTGHSNGSDKSPMV
jgi:hypothetical protein